VELLRTGSISSTYPNSGVETPLTAIHNYGGFITISSHAGTILYARMGAERFIYLASSLTFISWEQFWPGGVRLSRLEHEETKEAGLLCYEARTRFFTNNEPCCRSLSELPH
jgi:hypothetical protein